MMLIMEMNMHHTVFQKMALARYANVVAISLMLIIFIGCLADFYRVTRNAERHRKFSNVQCNSLTNFSRSMKSEFSGDEK